MALYTIALAFCYLAVAAQALVTVSNLAKPNTFGASGNVFCNAGFSAGQLAGVCTLVKGFQLGSATDALAAARFRGFGPDEPALSTDPGVMGMVADFLFNATEQTSRMDIAKHITASSQVDMFLCSDAKCKVLADLIHVMSGTTDTHDANTPTLAIGYTRLPFTLLALPTSFLDPRMTSNTSPQVSGSLYDVQKVAWTMPEEPQWSRPPPLISDLGSLARILSNNKNFNWSKLRLGSYHLNGDSSTCATAWINLAGKPLVEYNENIRGPVRSTKAILDNIGAINANDPTLTTMVPDPRPELNLYTTLYYWGANSICVNTFAAGPSVVDVCSVVDQHGGLMTHQSVPATAVMIGHAPVVVFNITDPLGWTPEGPAPEYLNFMQEDDPATVGVSAAELLLNLVDMSTLDVMPWCTRPGNDHWIVTVVLRNGTTSNMRDCITTWRDYGWGPVRSSAKVPASSGAEMTDQLIVSWTNTSTSAWFNQAAFGLTGTDASRKEIDHVVRKAAPQWIARVAVALASFVAIALPAVMAAVGHVKAKANNPDGSSAEITWVYNEAAADDGYRIVAPVSTTFATVYDPVAEILMWTNLAVALTATAIIMYAVLWRQRRVVQEATLPRRTQSTGWAEEIPSC
ncbi:hypothetical protein JKP88DRAFT_264464 [Tribonema minus]|uniref:Uncharacterized protein n=1 Tax=Tribonema minus TaxID=303371 RepID=A0A835YNU5_9STRA|nr:hypothetical protein JKP88DRAFT_264464 [Tribonema minus]